MDRRIFLNGLAAASIVGAWPLAPAAQTPHTHRHRFDDAQRWAQIFDDPARDAWQRPHQVIEALALAPDAIVADIGAGTGYFAVRLAHRVPQGRVYAVDTEPDMVRHLAERAKRDGLANLTPIEARADDPKLPQPVDLALFVNVYHHIERRPQYFRRIADTLKPGGRIAIIDFTLDSPQGPPKATRIEPQRVKSEMAEAGYTLAGQHGFLPHQYFLVFASDRR
ncbi:MAG TPA: class I SAM-dependent methyltransferase [Burkholderiaceae bacterium]|nr:class I SAM-dependent methyltransferase [Burkholderiaceae bacterium]